MLLLQHTEEMDGAKFAKLCRDSKLLSSAVTASDADLFFAKVGTLPCSITVSMPNDINHNVQPAHHTTDIL